jgi:hypothetical protein
MLRFCSLFCSVSARFFGWWEVFASGFSVPSYVLLWLLVSPWCLLFVVVRSVCFVRFPRPRGFFGWSRSVFSWRCCPVSALGSVRASGFVAVVRPAVVARRSGVLLSVWVLVASPQDPN